MTDTPATAPAVAASEILGGQMSIDAARATIAARITDKDFYRNLSSPDADKSQPARAEWDALHKAAFPTPAEYSLDTINQLPAHHDARRTAEMNSTRAAQMAADGYTPLQVHQIMGGRPMPASEHDFHDRRFDALKKDVAFMARWSKGDREARLEMSKHISGRAMRVGTLEEIQRWDAAHPYAGA